MKLFNINQRKIPVDENIFERIHKAGGNCYLVGGAVRNMMLDKKPKDYDFVVENLSEDKLKDLFPESKYVGESFGVFKINGHDFALCRKESLQDNAKSRRDFNVIHNEVDIHTDLKRRDYSVNAVAVDMKNGDIVDPYNGIEDINNNRLRAFNDAYKEDPLRILRGARLASQYNLEIDKNTIEMMKKAKHKLKMLPKERVFEEFRKVINSDHPARFFEELLKANCLDIWFKEIANMYGIPQSPKHHKERDVLEHAILSLEYISKYTDKEHIRFATFMHDIGKGQTPYQEWVSHYRHDKKGLNEIENFADRLSIPNKWEKTAKFFIKEHMRAKYWREMSPGKVVRLFEKIRRLPILIENFELMLKADLKSRKREIKNCKTEGLCELYYSMYEETNGDMIDKERYTGKEIGNQLFQLRCHWLKNRRNKILKELNK